MDFLAHGLWSNAAFEAAAQVKKKARSWRDIWLPVFFGVAPDLFSFGVLLAVNLFTSGTVWPYAQARLEEEWGRELAAVSPRLLSGPSGPPDPSLIPQYVHTLYDVTHSLLLFAIIFGIIWVIRRRPYWPFAAWGLHIVTDVFSHSDKFFPTPFLFPLSDFHIDGVSWADPIFMIVNYTLILAVYLWLYKFRRRGEIKYNSKDVKT